MEYKEFDSVTKAEVIWDHSMDNQGWYVRLYLSNGQQRDNSFTARRDIGIARARKEARKEARAWGWHMPPGTPVLLHGSRSHK